VVVNGQPLFDDVDHVQQYVCAAYTGKRCPPYAILYHSLSIRSLSLFFAIFALRLCEPPKVLGPEGAL
jgi:hypothetical protein